MTNLIGYVICIAAGLLILSSNAKSQMIRGIPGVDYPNYRSIPKTSFRCSNQKYIPGFYADVETDCQVFHFCYKRRAEKFLCPIGTIFNQATLACDSWFNSNCSLASMYYIVNASPGMKNAGRNIPMLMRLRERAHASTVTQPPAEAPETTEPITEESTTEEHSTFPSFIEIDSNVAESEVPESYDLQESQFEEDQVPEEVPSMDNLEDENLPLGFSENAGGFDQFEAEPEEKMIFDSDSSRDVANSKPEPQWKDAVTEEFQGFYDFDPKQSKESPFRQLPKEALLKAKGSSSLPKQKKVLAQVKQAEEFAKRLAHISHVPKRARRKPTYPVVEKRPEHKPPVVFETTTTELPSTEAPFTESISIDTLVELNTELPDGYSLVKNEEGYNEYESDSQMDENEEPEDEVEELYSTSTYDDEDRYDGDEQNDLETDRSFKETDEDESDQYVPESLDSEVDSLEDLEGETDDVESDDFQNPQVTDEEEIAPKSDLNEVFVVIPDETDFPSTPAPDVPEDVSEEPEDEESELDDAFEVPSDSQAPDDDIYIVNDVDGQPGYGYQGMRGAGGQAYYPQAQGGYGPYGVPRVVPGRSYGYQAPAAGMRYPHPQYRGPVPGYNYGPFQGYPEGYYQYVDEFGRPLNPQFVNPTSDHLPEDPRRGNEPNDMYEHGVYGDSYPYRNIQPGHRPTGAAGQYAYNLKPGYYQGQDGRFYSSDGMEVQAPVAANPIGSIEQGKEMKQYPQQTEYPEQPDSSDECTEGDCFDSEDSEMGDEFIKDSRDSGAASDTSVEAMTMEVDAKILEPTESSLPEDFGVKNDSFTVLGDEEAGLVDFEEDSAVEDEENLPEEFEEADESSDLAGSSMEDKQAEELVAEETEGEFNETKPFYGEDLDSTADFSSDIVDGKNVFESAVPEAVIQEEDINKSGPSAPEVESAWAGGQSGGMDSLNPPLFPSEPATAQQPSSFGSVPSPQDFTAPTENQFQNQMNFAPYGFGPNMGQQFGMLDSTSRPPFSSKAGKAPGRPGKRNPESLGSLQDRVRFMKRGKFGMFKKYMNTMNIE